MILRRLGNKSKIAKEIQKHFPPHKIYIEPFFGAGGMFFNKPKAKYNIVNDLDSDVFNLFMVVVNQKEEFRQMLKIMPIHSDLISYWKNTKEECELKKALRFIALSNFTLNGTGSNIRSNVLENPKIEIFKHLKFTLEYLQDVKFMNFDYRKFISTLAFRPNSKEVEDSFIYCDPPYLSTNDNYSHSFTETDSIDLFNCLQETGCKFAMSEFDNPFILNQAKERGLNVHIIGERQNLKNRRTEILVTNYVQALTLF
jgi:DNA adenine methylase